MTAYTLNLIDLALTLHALTWGAWEVNPLIRSVPVMIVYKMVIVGVLCWWLSRREEPLARYGLDVASVWYGAVNIWHIINIAAIWAA